MSTTNTEWYFGSFKIGLCKNRATAQILNSIQSLSPPVSEISLACWLMFFFSGSWRKCLPCWKCSWFGFNLRWSSEQFHGDNVSDFFIFCFYVSGGEMRALHDLHAASASLAHSFSRRQEQRGWKKEVVLLLIGVCSVLGVSKSCGVQWRVNPSCPRSLSCPPSLSSLRARKHHIQVTARIAVSLQKYHKSIMDLIVSQDIRTNNHVLTLLRCF